MPPWYLNIIYVKGISVGPKCTHQLMNSEHTAVYGGALIACYTVKSAIVVPQEEANKPINDKYIHS